MKSVLISELKAKFIRLLKTINETYHPPLGALRGKPLAGIEPGQASPKHQVQLGAMRDTLEIKTDIVYADSSPDWEIEH